MGYSTSAYAFFGVHVPREAFPQPEPGDDHWGERERVQEILHRNGAELPDVGYLEAGSYDDDMLFLTADVTPDEGVEIALGSYKRFEPANSYRLMELTGQLGRAVELLGYDKSAIEAPGYIVVPDYS